MIIMIIIYNKNLKKSNYFHKIIYTLIENYITKYYCFLPFKTLIIKNKKTTKILFDLY